MVGGRLKGAEVMPTAAEREIDPAFVGAFQRDGFVHLTRLLDPDEVAGYRSAVDAAVERRKRNDTRALADKSPYEQSFIQCQYLWEDCPDVRPLTFHPKVVGAAAALIGAAAMRVWHDQALYKEAGGRETDAHQDHPYWPIVQHHALTAWIPLVAVDHETGCMGYVPGSHRGRREYVNIFTDPGSGAKLLEQFAPVEPVFVPCKAGDVIFHHGSTAHLAKPNRSSGMRRVHTAIYFADGAVRSETPSHHPSVDRAGIAVGAVIGSGVTPIAWPIEDGNLPVPVPWPDSKRVQTLKRLGIVPDQVR
jgi:ectoine hydroxylase-related dioxygenase (phytanoyl-CoA dioxygenase family)